MRTLIIGAGGHGKVVLDILRSSKSHEVIGFADADPRLVGKTVAGLSVLGPVSQLHKLIRSHKLKAAIIAIGDNSARAGYLPTLLEHGLEPITAIHPSAVVAGGARLGRGCVIAAGAVVCTETVLGDGVIVNTGASIDHECELGDWVHVCPGARVAGRVRMGAGAFIGMGANVIQCLSIGDGAVIGAGAVVLSDLPAGVTVVGVPARATKRTAVAA
jgi:sugar O-acyltransferase (sialic acid O-acetyltransferase NeuD family)